MSALRLEPDLSPGMKHTGGRSARLPCKCGRYVSVRLDTDGAGRVVEVGRGRCYRCNPLPKAKAEWARRVNVARRRACVCQYCDKPTVGRPRVALYCEEHRRLAKKRIKKRCQCKTRYRAQNAWKARNREKTREMARRYYQKSEEVRARRNEYKRQWRQRNRDKVKAQKRRSALRGVLRESMRRRREAGKVSQPTRRNLRGQRLCLTPDCQSVLTGRAKLCNECRNPRMRRAA